jgi:hypothetical protein
MQLLAQKFPKTVILATKMFKIHYFKHGNAEKRLFWTLKVREHANLTKKFRKIIILDLKISENYNLDLKISKLTFLTLQMPEKT